MGNQGQLFRTNMYGNVVPAPYEGQRDTAAEIARLSNQCRAILERLQRGPATNNELAAISRKYTGRISDLRAAGIGVECYKQDRPSGLSWYRLAKRPETGGGRP